MCEEKYRSIKNKENPEEYDKIMEESPDCEEYMCKKFRDVKVKENVHRWKHEGRYVSQSQAIAVGYSQARRGLPKCVKYLSK